MPTTKYRPIPRWTRFLWASEQLVPADLHEPFLRRWLRQPLLHFLIVGAALFVVSAYMTPERSGEPSKEITFTLDELRQLATSGSRRLTPEELSRQVELMAQEELLYREALAMGLDKDDAVVRHHLAEKVKLVTREMAATQKPTTADLERWFREHAFLFAVPARVTFRVLYFSPDRRGTRARDEAMAALAKLADQPEDSKLAMSLADPFRLQDHHADRTPQEISKEFGAQFAVALLQASQGSWQGPIESSHGWHLVWLKSVVPSRNPDFAEVERLMVENAWLNAQREEAWRKAYAAMRAKYSVHMPATPEEIVAGTLPAPTRESGVPAPSAEASR